MERGKWAEGARLAGHGLVVAGFAALGLELLRRFWDVQLSLAGWAVGFAAWGLAAAVETWLRTRFDRKRTLSLTLLLAAVAACVGVTLTWLGWKQSGGVESGAVVPWWRMAALAALLLVFLRGACWRAAVAGADWLAEEWRWLLLGAIVPAVSWALWTPCFAGGVDARWYAYNLHDFLEQWRAGVFPVWVGQGELAFNGPVHPFRTAPAYHYLGGLLDSATGRTLGVFALQHLIAVTVTALGAVAAYMAWVSLVPQRRWIACLVAGLYVAAPGLLALLQRQEMYMTYMTVPLLPLLVAATVRVIDRQEKSAIVSMAMSGAALWFCHAPVALWAWLACFSLLGLNVAIRGVSRADLTGLAAVTLLFLWLTHYQFRNVAEFTPVTTRSELMQLLPMGGLAAGLWAGGCYLAGRIWQAGLLAAAALFVVWNGGMPYAMAIVSCLTFVLLARQLIGSSPGGETAAPWLMGAVLGGLVAAVVTAQLVGRQSSPAAVEALDFVRSLWPGSIEPISSVPKRGDVQPGWILLAFGLGALVWAGIVRQRLASLLAAVLLPLSLLLFPIKWVTASLWAQLPVPLLVATSGAVTYRMAPAWITLLAVAGLLSIEHLLRRRPKLYPLLAGVLSAGVLWCVSQSQWLNRHLLLLRNSEIQSADLLRTENAALPIYNYNFLDVPARFSHGVMDYRSESRLLHPATNEIMARPEHREVKRLALRATPGGPNQWHNLNTRLELGPLDRKVLRFSFREKAPDGLLLFTGPRFYREYILPSSGMAEGFGAASGNGHDIVVWNSLSHPVDFEFFWVSSRSLPEEGLDFAEVAVLEEIPGTLPVTTLSLTPTYRVAVNAPGETLLETPRRFIPGYKATRNGTPAEMVRLTTGQVGVRLPSGESLVEIAFVGSEGLRRAGLISLFGWAVALTVWAWLKWRQL